MSFSLRLKVWDWNFLDDKLINILKLKNNLQPKYNLVPLRNIIKFVIKLLP